MSDLMNSFRKVEHLEIFSTDLEDILKKYFDNISDDWYYRKVEWVDDLTFTEFKVASIEMQNKDKYTVNSSYVTQHLLNDLCYRKLIKPGNYLVFTEA